MSWDHGAKIALGTMSKIWLDEMQELLNKPTFAQMTEQTLSNVKSPNHYVAGYFETIYEIHDVLGREGFKAFCMGNYIKYNARANHKGLKSEDLQKAEQYLEWATNGLPSPVDGRVPRNPEQPDLYQQFADAMAQEAAIGDGSEGAANADYSQLERRVAASAALGAAFAGEAQANPVERTSGQVGPNAKTVANAIGPALRDKVSGEIFAQVRLRVTREMSDCPKYGKHTYYVAYVYDREDDDEIARAMMLTEDPNEEVCSAVAETLAEVINYYFS